MVKERLDRLEQKNRQRLNFKLGSLYMGKLTQRIRRLVLYTAKYFGLMRLSRIFTSGQLRILAYHNFTGSADVLEWHPKLFISPGTFTKRMDYLRQNGYEVLGLDQALKRLKTGTLKGSPVVITIDDGWHGTLIHAHPVLTKNSFPYTIYVTSYYSNNPHPVFNLVIPYLFFKAPPKKVTMSGPGIPNLGQVDLSNKKQVEETARKLIETGQKGKNADRNQIIETLAKILDLDMTSLKKSQLFNIMVPRTLSALVEDGVDLQLHTHRHNWPIEKNAAQEELESNSKYLMEVRPDRPMHFCYPSGFYTKGQFDYLQGCGIKTAATCKPGFNTGTDNPYELKRFLDGENISQVEFEAEMSGFLELLRRARNKIGRGGII